MSIDTFKIIRKLFLISLFLPLFSGCGIVRSTASDKPLVTQCPREVMELCVPPDYPSSDNILYIIGNDDSAILGLFEGCVLKDKAKEACLKKLEENGVLRTDGK